MKILITGAYGFLGKNLALRLEELEDYELFLAGRDTPLDLLKDFTVKADFIFHLAGSNRPDDVDDFQIINVGLTQYICDVLKSANKRTPILFSSSVHAGRKTEYGKTKLEAERLLTDLEKSNENSVHVYRLNSVFGKWSKPNYNSVVSTFCYQIARGLSIDIHDPNHLLSLVYIDDVIDEFIAVLRSGNTDGHDNNINPVYKITVGELAAKLKGFNQSRETLILSNVGYGLERALYSTYLTYLPTTKFSYELIEHADERGAFVEMHKSVAGGQFSFFTAKPGVSRGGHYHHSKTEKFLVVCGSAEFKFRNISTGEQICLSVSSLAPTVVETVPGWAHNITNVGSSDLVCLLWANEIFSPKAPDTIAAPV